MALADTFSWTAYDRVKFALDLPEGIPLKAQERAYTSPIWYTPATETAATARFGGGATVASTADETKR